MLYNTDQTIQSTRSIGADHIIYILRFGNGMVIELDPIFGDTTTGV